jgi:hypothetical protein
MIPKNLPSESDKDLNRMINADIDFEEHEKGLRTCPVCDQATTQSFKHGLCRDCHDFEASDCEECHPLRRKP